MRRLPRALLLVAFSTSVSATWAPVAHAQGSSNEAAAEALFNEGRALIDGGHLQEGCKKLEASQALDPGTGTMLHLADCYERTGRTATAWARFREAASRANRDGRTDWEGIAKTRARELEPKLAMLRIDAAPGVTVRRDGVDIPPAALGTPLPLDPGPHHVVGSAPGKKAWSTDVEAVASRTVTLTVPALDAEAAAAVPGAHPDSSEPPGASPLPTIGYVVGAVGIVAFGVGTVAGISAISLDHRSKSTCPNPGICPDQGARDDADSARSAATVSTIGFIAGGVLLATGIGLVVFAPRASAASATSAQARLVPRLRLSPQALWLEGMW